MAVNFLSKIGKALLAKVMNDKPLYHFSLTAFDNLLDGMHANRVNIISGDPGAGKSTFMGKLADDAAANGVSVFLHSFELANSCYFAMSLARSSGGKVGVKEISDPAKSQLVMEIGEKYLEQASQNIVFLEESDSVNDLHKLVKKQREQHPEKPILVICDYIQIALNGNVKESSDERVEIKETLGKLRQIAKVENTAVFAVSSVARGSYDKKEPSLSALSGSSSLEYGCDTCIHLSTDADEDSLMKPVTLTMLKNRFGAKGKADLFFDVEHADFTEA